MPLIHGSSDETRSRNIATLRREGLHEKQAVAAAYRIQRQAKRRRRKRNPKSGLAWGWLLGGFVAGAAYAIYNDTAGPGAASKPPLEVIAYDALGLGGVGLFLLGVAGGLFTGSHATVALGAIGGVAAFGVGTALSISKVAT